MQPDAGRIFKRCLESATSLMFDWRVELPPIASMFPSSKRVPPPPHRSGAFVVNSDLPCFQIASENNLDALVVAVLSPEGHA